MRLVRRISIISLVVSIATLALVLVMLVGDQWESAEDTPIFTENEVEKLIRYSQSDINCFQNFIGFYFADNEYQPITTRQESKAGHPSQTFEYSFKSDGRWLVDVTTSWKIEEHYLDKNPTLPEVYLGYFMSENKDQIELNCMYMVNEHTGKVTIMGQRATIQGN